MVGFRAPLLVHNPAVRANLAAEGMLYDSSIIEFYAPDSTTSPNASTRLWPYTMDQGIPQVCGGGWGGGWPAGCWWWVGGG